MSAPIWVAGFPSFYGGADTELDHLLDLFSLFGVSIDLVPMFGANPAMKTSVVKRGHRIHEYRDNIFKNKIVISFCNGEFLECLPKIMDAGAPARVIWFNCMTWLFPAEIEAHTKGWIDDFGFISNYQRQCLAPQLQDINSFREFDYHPYFNFKRILWQYRAWNGTYQIGRISRDDGAKFANDTWQIFERVLVPKTLATKTFILGYGPNAAEKTGPAPPTLDWLTWAPNAIDSTEFYRTVDTMIHKTGGSGESYSMVLLEAYAHGVVPIVEENYAFPELVVHGETGFMTNDSDEMSYYASQLAWSPEKHQRMAKNGRKFLENTIIDENKSWSCWEKL